MHDNGPKLKYTKSSMVGEHPKTIAANSPSLPASCQHLSRIPLRLQRWSARFHEVQAVVGRRLQLVESNVLDRACAANALNVAPL